MFLSVCGFKFNFFPNTCIVFEIFLIPLPLDSEHTDQPLGYGAGYSEHCVSGVIHVDVGGVVDVSVAQHEAIGDQVSHEDGHGYSHRVEHCQTLQDKQGFLVRVQSAKRWKKIVVLFHRFDLTGNGTYCSSRLPQPTHLTPTPPTSPSYHPTPTLP